MTALDQQIADLQQQWSAIVERGRRRAGIPKDYGGQVNLVLEGDEQTVLQRLTALRLERGDPWWTVK